ncbi:MAG: hypothetical protein IPJ19_01640 [Planctomycetes bacterium]|nr:hypothetical protein [Planctomycetota bacterium]
MLAPLARAQAPLHTLVSWYTPGEQLGLEVTPDGSRAFVARGSTISFVDLLHLTQVPPIQNVQIDEFSMRECQPLALRYYHQLSPAQDYLYIAGGATGVWRLELCPSLFNAQNPGSCSNYHELQVEAPIEFGYFERKRCVDVEILEHHNPPILFALFGSRSDQSSVGDVTELRAYDLGGATPVPIGSMPFDFATAPNPVQVGTSLAADPGDDDSVYVGMGKGGIWRVDLAGSAGSWSLARTQIWTPGLCGGASPEHVRDLAIVRVGTPPTQKAVLYGALNYGEVLEIPNLAANPLQCNVISLGNPSAGHVLGYPNKIAAIRNSGDKVCVVVAPAGDDGKSQDALAPRKPNSTWNTICLGFGELDPDAPPLDSTYPTGLWIYDHDFGVAGSSLTLRAIQPYSEDALWNNVVLREQSGGTTNSLFSNSELFATDIFNLPVGSGSVSTATGSPWRGSAFHAQDSVVSTVNPGVVLFSAEYPLDATLAAEKMVYVDPISSTVTPVAQTVNSPCVGRTPFAPNCPDYSVHAVRPQDPGLYEASLLDEAHWIDPANPNNEYFLAGRQLLDRHDPSGAGCPTILDCDSNFANWCDSNGDPKWNLQKRAMPRVGWHLIRLTLPTPPLAPPNGPWMQAKSWRFEDPVEPASGVLTWQFLRPGRAELTNRRSIAVGRGSAIEERSADCRLPLALGDLARSDGVPHRRPDERGCGELPRASTQRAWGDAEWAQRKGCPDSPRT